jgi:AraC-like DNA-binding protein
VVARVLALLHGEPARRWSIDALAGESGASRSVVAERFSHFVGMPPMHYLTQWRGQLASHLLAQPGVNKVAAVAEAVGYDSEAAFSRAFKKNTGLAPSKWRMTVVLIFPKYILVTSPRLIQLGSTACKKRCRTKIPKRYEVFLLKKDVLFGHGIKSKRYFCTTFICMRAFKVLSYYKYF